jgi:hypothetical protein
VGGGGATIGWDAVIERAVTEPDPVAANRLITQAHHDLGLALRDLTGPDTGANFHAWATWGSREAGTTIRREDVPGLARLAPARPVLDRARAAISAGNRLVLDDIGRATGRFVSGADPGAGGLLTAAFARYRAAADPTLGLESRRALAFDANYAAVWHEHVRLQPYIAAAVPRRLRRCVTRRLLDFWVGGAHLHVAHDVSPGSAARDWTDFADRMRYVHELFRVHHLWPAVFAPPYDDVTTQRLRRALGLDRDGRPRAARAGPVHAARKPADRTGFRSRPAAHRTSTT